MAMPICTSWQLAPLVLLPGQIAFLHRTIAPVRSRAAPRDGERAVGVEDPGTLITHIRRTSDLVEDVEAAYASSLSKRVA